MANNAFGIDLGTRTIKIYTSHGDNVVVEKNMIAIEDKKILPLKCLKKRLPISKCPIRYATVSLRI